MERTLAESATSCASSTRRGSVLNGREAGNADKGIRMAIPLTRSTRLVHHREGYALLRCEHCDHRREISVESLARLVGWESVLVDQLARFRCSSCGARKIEISFGYDRKPRRWSKNPS
jgi:transcription elongation factor Elf1